MSGEVAMYSPYHCKNNNSNNNNMPKLRACTHPHQTELIAKPTKSDVLCGRGGAVNSHEGNVHFRSLVFSLKEEYFSEKTRKLEKANIARRIMGQIQSLDPPGRFLKQDASTKLWVEISNNKAKKKVGQAFRDIVSPDERSHLGVEVSTAEISTADTAHIEPLSQQDGASSPIHRDGSITPPLPPLPPPLQPVEENGEYTSHCDCLSPDDESDGSPRIDMGVCDHVIMNACMSYVRENRANELHQSTDKTNNQTHDYQENGGTRSSDAIYQNTSNTKPSTLYGDDSRLERKMSRLPIAEFSLHSNVGNRDEAQVAQQTRRVGKLASFDTGGNTDAENTTDSASNITSEIEKVTVDLLVKRARIWEDMYYSERDYSRKLEDHLVAIIGDRQRLPKRRKCCEAGESPLAA